MPFRYSPKLADGQLDILIMELLHRFPATRYEIDVCLNAQRQPRSSPITLSVIHRSILRLQALGVVEIIAYIAYSREGYGLQKVYGIAPGVSWNTLSTP